MYHLALIFLHLFTMMLIISACECHLVFYILCDLFFYFIFSAVLDATLSDS